MEYIVLNLDDVTEEELLKALDENSRITKIKSREIETMKKSKAAKKPALEEPTDTEPLSETKNTDNVSTKDEAFEDEVAYYYACLQKLTKDNLEDEIATSLPSKSNPNYEKLMQRLKAEVLKEIKELKEFVLGETITAEDLAEFREELLTGQRKISLIDTILSAIEESQEEDAPVDENNLIFVPTSYGTIRVLEEMSHIPEEYYDDFKSLFQSIKDGTFKNVKRFSFGSAAINIAEVKGWQTRVVFNRLDKNSYAIITAFIKKSDNDLGYRNSLENVCSNYWKMEESIKKNLHNEDFLSLNKQYEEELFRCLSREKEVPTVKRKDAQNG